MTYKKLGSAALGLLVVSACSGSGTGPASSTSAPAATPSKGSTTQPPPSAAVDPLTELLQQGDVPSGYEQIAPPTSGGAAPASTNLPCGLTPTTAVRGKAAVGYAKKQTGETLNDLVLVLAPGQGKDLLDQVGKALDSCRTITTMVGSASVTETITKVAAPRIGDQTLEATFKAQMSGVTVGGTIFAVRRGDQIGYVVLTSTGPVDAGVAEGLARRQADKL